MVKFLPKFVPNTSCRQYILIVSKSGYAIFDFFATNPQSELFLVSETKKNKKRCYQDSIQLIERKSRISLERD